MNIINGINERSGVETVEQTGTWNDTARRGESIT